MVSPSLEMHRPRVTPGYDRQPRRAGGGFQKLSDIYLGGFATMSAEDPNPVNSQDKIISDRMPQLDGRRGMKSENRLSWFIAELGHLPGDQGSDQSVGRKDIPWSRCGKRL